jgi:hypothetical protein
MPKMHYELSFPATRFRENEDLYQALNRISTRDLLLEIHQTISTLLYINWMKKWRFGIEDFTNILCKRRKWLNKDTPEIHLAKAYSYGSIDYWRDIHEASCEYLTLADAYNDLNEKPGINHKLDVFKANYFTIKKSIYLPDY